MESVPFDKFLQDLADREVYPDSRHIQDADVQAIWEDVPGAKRRDYLSELGLDPSEQGPFEPRLDGTDVIFGLEDEAVPTEDDPAIDAAESLANLDESELEAMLADENLEAIPDSELEATTAEAAELVSEPADADQLPEREDADQLPEREDADAIGTPDPSDADELPVEDAAAIEEVDDLAELEATSLEDVDEDEMLAAAEAEALPVEDVELEDVDLDDLDDVAATEPVGAGDIEGGMQQANRGSEGSKREIEVYPVYEPYGYVRITYDESDHQYLYEVIEPELSDREAKILEFIEETIIDVIDVGLSKLTDAEAENMLVELTDQVIHDYSIEVDESARMRLTYYVVRDFLGFGKLDIIMRDPMIEDISCDGSGIPIFLYHRKYESVASTVVFEEDTELDSFVIKLAQRSGKHISVADPLLDARLPDGSRLNATLSREVTASGSTFTIRKFRDEPFTPPDLIRFGTMSPRMLAYFWMAIQHGASMIVAGGTASGKTTMLNAVLLFIPPQMKIVSIEDTRELNLPHPNWIPGTTRSGFGPRDDKGRQAGEIDMFQLLKAALRQRPEYITVGEVRGEEATVLFQAMATGHAAYGTMHADSVTSVIHRLEGEPINIPRPLLEALDIVSIQIQTRIGGKRVRRTKEVVELVGMDPNTKELLTNEVFAWDPATDEQEGSGISYVLERIQRENNMSKPELDQEMDRRTLIIEWMREKEVRDYVDVAKVVQAYYNEPEDTIHKIRVDLGLEEAAPDEDIDLVDELLASDDEGDSHGLHEHETDDDDMHAEIPVPDNVEEVSPLGLEAEAYTTPEVEADALAEDTAEPSEAADADQGLSEAEALEQADGGPPVQEEPMEVDGLDDLEDLDEVSDLDDPGDLDGLEDLEDVEAIDEASEDLDEAELSEAPDQEGTNEDTDQEETSAMDAQDDEDQRA